MTSVIKRFTSIFLTLAMVSSMLSAQAFEAGEDEKEETGAPLLTEERDSATGEGEGTGITLPAEGDPIGGTEAESEGTDGADILPDPFDPETDESAGPEQQEEEPVYDPLALEPAVEGIVTRGEWLHDLVDLFQMTLTQDEYPDVYFPDIEGTAYYDDIMVATKYGLVDVEAGENFMPDDPLTREYAAYSLNFCLGLQSDGTYTYSDQNDVTYQNDAQTALDNGWLALVDGAFCPRAEVTAAECAAMLESAGSILESRDVSTSKSNIEFAGYVKVLPASAEVLTEFNPDTGARTLTIYDYEDLSAGDTFAYYYEDFAFVFSAVTVESVGGALEVTVSEPPEGAILQYEYSGSLTPEITDFIPDSQPVTLTEADGTAVTFGAVRAININIKDREITFSRDILKSNGIRGNLNGKITADRLDVNIHGSNKYAKLIGGIQITSTVEFDALNDPAARQLTLGGLQLGAFGYVGLELSLKMEAKIDYTYNANYEFGFQYADGYGSVIRDLRPFGDGNCFSADGTVSAQLSLAAYIDLGPAGSVSGRIGAGPVIMAGSKQYGSGTPGQCISLSGYFYAGISCSTTVKKPFSNEPIFKPYKYDFYNEKNSPIRVYKHIEDGVEVAACTRGNDSGTTSGSYTQSKYYTPSGSRYYASGNTNVNTGSGTTVTWLTSDNDDGTLTITGYQGGASILNIPETIDGKTVTMIGERAFQNSQNIRMVNMPNTIKSIALWAFEDCKNLKTVKFSESLTEMGNGTFDNCTSLVEVVLPESLTEFSSSGGFAGCTSLERVYIPSNLTEITSLSRGVFENCSMLNDVTFGDGIPVIPKNLFRNCTGLTHIEIPDTVTTIDDWAFEGCVNLQTIHFSENLTEIGWGAFDKCTSLVEVIFPEGLTTFNSYGGFEGCTSLEHIYIPSNLTSIYSLSDGIFKNCSKLNDVTFGEGITMIPQNLFRNCTGLTQIEIPNTVTSIDNHAFEGCTNLQTISFSENLTEIGGNAFDRCTSLVETIFPESLTTFSGSGGFAECSSLESVYIPSNLTEIYSISSGVFQNCAKLNDITFGNGITAIPQNLFRNCTGLTHIEIPDTVKEIGSSAFAGCKNLSTVTFNENLTTIGASAFNNSGLISIEIPNTITKYESGILQNCANLISVKLSKNALVIPSSMFSDCTALQKVDMPEGITEIAPYTFQRCAALADLSFLPSTITSIETRAFNQCTGLASADLPDLVSTLALFAFNGCTSLTTFKASNDLLTIGNNCFQDCANLTDVILNDGLISIGNYAFQNCAALETIVLPDSVTTLGTYAFQKDPKLVNVTLSASLKEIPSYAFANCTAMTELIIPKGVTSIAAYAFYQDTALKTFTIPASVTSIGSNAFSYPTTTAVYGVSGSYAQTFAKWKSFTDITKAATGVKLSSGAGTMTMGSYLTVTPEFTFVPADSTDVVMSLSSDNTSVVSVRNNTQLYGSRTGSANITATTSGGLTWTFTVTVAAVTGIEIGHLPNITNYGLKEDKNLDGLVVNAVFANGGREAVTGYTVKGFDTDSAGVKTVTVTYANKTTTFDITVAQVETGVMTNPANGKTISWSYNDTARTVTLTGNIPEDEQVLVAKYGPGGRFLGLEMVSRSRTVDVSSGKEVLLIWADKNTYIPISESKRISQ